MARQILVVENPADWKLGTAHGEVMRVEEYLGQAELLKQKDVQVVNLCRSYKYLSAGYYCSLLAEARRHRVLPSVKTILDLSSKAMYSLDAEDLDETIDKTLGRRRHEPPASALALDVFFGHCALPGLEKLARQIFETFPAPLLRVDFQRQGRWRIASIKSLSIHRLDAEQTELFNHALSQYQKKRWRSPRSKSVSRYDLAILYNPEDPLPPSDARALKNFARAGKELGVDVELVEKKDYSRLAEYDALFIRDTTRINHYTYRFAKKAESEGMVVIDDPASILRCTNKVYLAELLRTNGVPAPRTRILRKSALETIADEVGYPAVLKVPDGSFSRGVHKAEDRTAMLAVAGRLLKESDLILAQEFMYTDFDWRIGILNREPLYACQYFMSKKHWQIVNYDKSGRAQEGAFKTWPVQEVPPGAVKVALAAANLIGDGLYGVDVKQRGDEFYVIEVNDNPNLEAGVEDAVLKDDLYRRIMGEFVRRLEQRR